MKRVFALLMAFALLFCAAPPVAFAQDDPADKVISSVITSGWWNWRTNFYKDGKFGCLDLDGPAQIKYLDSLPETMKAKTQSGLNIDLAVSWEEALLDFSPTGGLQTLRGEVVLPEGYSFWDAQPKFVTFCVLTLDEGSPTYTVLEDDSYMFPDGQAALLPVGGSLETVLRENLVILYDTLGVVLDYDYPDVVVPVDWGLNTLDTGRVGKTFLTPRPVLPANILLPEGTLYPPYTVQVAKENGIRLDFFRGRDRMGNLYFDWLWTVPDVTKMHIFVSTDGGKKYVDKTPSEKNDQCNTEDGIFHYTTNYLIFSPHNADANTTYTVYLSYEGKESNLLELKVDANFNTSFGIGGDRDGSKDSGNELPEVDQPGPKPTPKPTPSPAPTPASGVTPEPPPAPAQGPPAGDAAHPKTPLSSTPQNPVPLNERVTRTTSLYSGARLRKMLALGDSTLLFDGQGVSVELSAEFLRDLDLADSSTLEVRIERPKEHTFSLFLFVDERALSALPDTLVRLPFEDGSGLALYDETEAYLSDALWEQSTKTALCTIRKTGVYHLRPAPEAVPIMDADTPNAPIAPQEALPAPAAVQSKNGFVPWAVLLAGVGALIAVAGGVLLYRRWRRG